MMRALLPFVLLGTAWFAVSAASDSGEMPVNTWVKAEFDAQAALKDLEGARWLFTDGYSDSLFRTRTNELLIRTGLDSNAKGWSPGFYTNTTAAWKAASGELRVVEVSHWGGGSSGHGKLLPPFKEHETPSPRHTYDGICYVPEEDAMYLVYGANWRCGGTGADEDAKAQLKTDNDSTWKYDFASARWTRIEGNPSQFFKVSPYENHLAHWSGSGKLLYLNDGGNCHAEFDLASQKWTKVDLANKCPMRLYNARSTWDSKRGLWVFRLGAQLCTFDPRTRTFASLPNCYDVPAVAENDAKKKDPRYASKGVAYLPQHDVYLVSGPVGNDTRVYRIEAGAWTDLKAGEAPLPNGYIQFDPETGLVLLSYQLNIWKLRYEPRK